MTAGQRVGVLTFHRSINYGSYWQARCLVEGLRARGHDAELLDHRSVQIERHELRNAFQPALPIRTPRRHHPALARKTRAMADAVGRLPLSAPFALDDPAAMGRYDAVVVGSDEVWNFRHPWYGGKRLFFGEGVKAGRLVAYAASFGNHDAADGLDAESAARLRTFSALSVRDDNSRRLLADGLGTVPPTVLDPCLMFADRIAVEPVAGAGRYAVVYGSDLPGWFAAAVRRWADRTGTRLVSVGYASPVADEQRIDADPASFAALFAGACAVVTNFFHGCVFAMRNGKPFACASTPYRDNKVRDLTRSLGAERHLIGEEGGDGLLADLLGAAPAELAGGLAVGRERSERYLADALG